MNPDVFLLYSISYLLLDGSTPYDNLHPPSRLLARPISQNKQERRATREALKAKMPKARMPKAKMPKAPLAGVLDLIGTLVAYGEY